MKLLRITMETGKIEFERLREDWLPIGGSALLARIMNREVPPATDPLGPENAFILANGPLAGTGAPQLGRISVGAKSPLTLGIKEANKEKIWEVRIPPLPETLFGAGVAGKMGEALQRLKVKKLFIVTDPVMFSLGRAEEIRRIVEPRGLETVVFSEVEADPPIELIERAGRLYTESGCDGILGLGGGSSMDTAKALGLRVTHSGDLRDFEGIVGGGGKIKPILPPIVCLPTTSGTGSEVNPCAVITDRERDLKLVLMSNHLIPRLAVIDPLFCRTMPPGLTIASGIDALLCPNQPGNL